MEIVTNDVDLPTNIKEKVVEELKKNQCELSSQTPFGKGAFGCVYRAKKKTGGLPLAVKVVLIPEMIDEERVSLLGLIDKEVILYK